MLDFITKLLDLKEEDINDLDSVIIEDTSFFITLKQKSQPCKHCGCMTSIVHDYSTRKINYKALVHSDITVYYKARRYKCIHCGKSFVESNPFTASNRHLSTLNIIGILQDLKPYTATYTQIAKKYHVSVSTVVNLFDKHVQIDRKPFTPVLCLDEFYFNRHSKYKYAFIILDFETKQILDILESRWSVHLRDYFFHIDKKERDQVLYICTDMYQTYIDISKIYFKNASVCIDSFHVIKKINDHLDAVRKRIMRKYSENKYSKEYKLLKFNKRLLMISSEEIDSEKYFKSKTLGYTTTEAGLLEVILDIHEDLKAAYRLKEDYLSFNNTKPEDADRDTLDNELTDIINDMYKSGIVEFKEMAKTLKHYKKEILNSFVWFKGRRISNGPIEGKNTYIKKILSNANGMSNFPRARNRMLYSQNLHETFSASEKQEKIKKTGTPRGPYQKKK